MYNRGRGLIAAEHTQDVDKGTCTEGHRVQQTYNRRVVSKAMSDSDVSVDLNVSIYEVGVNYVDTASKNVIFNIYQTDY